MKITINIDDQELFEAAKEVAIRRIADDIFFGFSCRKQNIDDLSDRAVTAAAKMIENEVMKKMLDKVLNEED